MLCYLDQLIQSCLFQLTCYRQCVCDCVLPNDATYGRLQLQQQEQDDQG